MLFYGGGVKTDSAPKYWEKTRLNNLVRHTNGRYYARLYINGKEIWKSLKTTLFSVAEGKLSEMQKEHREHREKATVPANTRMTFEQAAAIHMQRIDERVTIKRRTKKYWKETLEALQRSWPALFKKEVRRITLEVCREWSTGYAKVASDNRYNNTVALLRHIFDVAIESAAIYSNPAADLERVKVRGKKLVLPTLAKFAEFTAEMRKAHSRDSKNCADLTEGLAYTGMRIGESGEVSLEDVNFDTGEVRVQGDPEEGTKNGDVRYVPMIPQARELFQRMLKDRAEAPETEKLFRVHECQKAMDRAAKIVGMARITHHDLRHFFATVCIESGVDIPTVSRWLGHKDGGVLAMRTYGHLRREHSVTQAQRVSFIPATAAA